MKAEIPVIMCDSEDGCDEWFIDNHEMGASSWRDLVPPGWVCDPRSDAPDLCPKHAEEVAA